MNNLHCTTYTSYSITAIPKKKLFMMHDIGKTTAHREPSNSVSK